MALEGGPSGEPTAKYAIAGETFLARRMDRGRVLITHPQWSLMGRGATLAQAEEDLRAEAGEVAKILGAKPPELLSKEATRLYRFALRIS